MTKGYAIFTVKINDRAGMDAYAQKAVPTALQYGGRPIVVDDNVEQLEGTWYGNRTVVVEFDSVDAARKWYNSAEYQAVIGGRHAAAETNAAIVAGFEMPAS